MSARTPGGAALNRPEQASAKPPLRFVSAASLFDGHDAAINMIRRLLQSHGAEVIHLGHNRSVADIVRAAIQEDADAVAVSSYQGGHNEYFEYMVDMLRERGRPDIRVIVSGGGTIDDVFARLGGVTKPPYEFGPLNPRDHGHIARTLSVLEGASLEGLDAQADLIRRALAKSKNKVPVIG